jgi:hypothetical protein
MLLRATCTHLEQVSNIGVRVDFRGDFNEVSNFKYFRHFSKMNLNLNRIIRQLAQREEFSIHQFVWITPSFHSQQT